MNKRLKNRFKHAFFGLKTAFLEQTFRILTLISVVVLIFAVILPVTPAERGILLILVACVLAFELINSQVERVLDLIEPNYKEKVRHIKDISAGAVLLMSIASAVIGIMILFPYLF